MCSLTCLQIMSPMISLPVLVLSKRSFKKAWFDSTNLVQLTKIFSTSCLLTTLLSIKGSSKTLCTIDMSSMYAFSVWISSLTQSCLIFSLEFSSTSTECHTQIKSFIYLSVIYFGNVIHTSFSVTRLLAFLTAVTF